MDILKVVDGKIYVRDKNGYIDSVIQDEHDIRTFRDIWGVPRFPLRIGFGEPQLL